MNYPLRYCITILMFFFTSLCCYAQDTLSVLLKNSVEVKSIDPMNEDYSDLLPLIEKIGSAKVVVLGEISHSDGATLAFKSRMVKFLHQKMGFDVLAWEAGELNCWNLNNALRSSLPLTLAKQRLMYGGWDNEEQVQPVFEYARASWNTERPLEMMGFDNNRPPYGISGFKTLLNELYKKSPGLKPSGETIIAIDSLITIQYGYLYLPMNLDSALPPQFREKALKGLSNIADKLSKPGVQLRSVMSEKQLSFYQFVINMALTTWLQTEAVYTKGNLEWNRNRDSAMGLSFKWQMENLYPGRKIIIWAATGHLTRNSHLKQVVGQQQMVNAYKQAGDYMYTWLGDDLYTIAGTSFKGTIGKVYPDYDDRRHSPYNYTDTVPLPPTGSYEHWAHATRKKYLFTDLRSAGKEDWLKKEFVSGCTGFIPTKAPWYKVIDALFFIDEMHPVRAISRGK